MLLLVVLLLLELLEFLTNLNKSFCLQDSSKREWERIEESLVQILSLFNLTPCFRKSLSSGEARRDDSI